MAILDKLLGHGKDTPLCFNENYAAAGAGGGADFEQPLMAIPQLSSPGSGLVGLARRNQVKLRQVMIVPSAAITGVATNNFTININWWRAGTKLGTISTITFGSGQNAAIHAPLVLPNPLFNNLPVVLLPGDSITVQRVSNGTGLASPQFIAVADYTLPDSGE